MNIPGNLKKTGIISKLIITVMDCFYRVVAAWYVFEKSLIHETIAEALSP